MAVHIDNLYSPLGAACPGVGIHRAQSALDQEPHLASRSHEGMMCDAVSRNAPDVDSQFSDVSRFLRILVERRPGVRQPRLPQCAPNIASRLAHSVHLVEPLYAHADADLRAAASMKG